MTMRRALVLAGLGVLAWNAPAQDGAGSSDRARWLLENAVKVRTIEPTDEDFGDLEPLIDLIGDARVVSLGEQTHGDGATFHAKCRLVRFLHQRMGFDVLAWESGMYDCRQVDAAFKRGEPIDDAVMKGIFGIWGMSQQCRPLFEYVAATQSTPRPIETAGFDCQLTGRGTLDSMRALIDDALTRLGPHEPIDEAIGETLRAGIERLKIRGMPEVAEADHESFQAAVRAILDRFAAPADVFEEGERSLLVRTLTNLGCAEEMSFHYGKPGDSTENWANQLKVGAIREIAMADTLVWLVNERLPDRRVIVWAASSHMSANEATIEMPTGFGWKAMGTDWLPMGEAVRDALGDDLYTIAFIAHHGNLGSVAGRSRVLEEPPPGSLDDLCHQTGVPFLFIDLGTLGAMAGGEWLAEPLMARPRGYGVMRTRWKGVCDAMFFTDEMFASTRTNGRSGSGSIPP